MANQQLSKTKLNETYHLQHHQKLRRSCTLLKRKMLYLCRDLSLGFPGTLSTPAAAAAAANQNTYDNADEIRDIRAPNIALKKRRLNSPLIQKRPIDCIHSPNNVQGRRQEHHLPLSRRCIHQWFRVPLLLVIPVKVLP